MGSLAGIVEVISSVKLPGWIPIILRIVIGGIFIYAGISKALAPVRFVTDISNFHLLPWMATAPLAFYLPWLEIVCGLTLVFFPRNRGAIFILLLLTFLFAGALAIARIRGLDISCGCFGHAARDLSFASHLTLNFGIIIALFLLMRPGVTRAGA